MDDNIRNLVKLYATHNREDLEQEDAGDHFEKALGKKFNTFYKEPWFGINKEKISIYKRSLEDFVKNAPDNRALIIKCLNFVWKEAVLVEESPPLFKENMEIFQELVIQSFSQSWSEGQMKHFKGIFEIFMDYYAYFLSYTNHFSQAINSVFKPIYQLILKKEDIPDEDLEKKNFLAKALVDWLKVKNLKRGFFDRYVIRQANNWENDIMKSTKKSLVFIQLISAASFEHSALNWSFKEYDSYKRERVQKPFSTYEGSGSGTIMFFFLLEKNALPNEDLTPAEYVQWRNDILAIQNSSNLYEIKTLDDFSTMIDTLINNIIYHKTKILETVPG